MFDSYIYICDIHCSKGQIDAQINLAALDVYWDTLLEQQERKLENIFKK